MHTFTNIEGSESEVRKDDGESAANVARQACKSGEIRAIAIASAFKITEAKLSYHKCDHRYANQYRVVDGLYGRQSPHSPNKYSVKEIFSWA